ncbi:MAG: hypothetical protein LBE89_06010 [Helicobacteraceae bacterium]|jgi:hypothetical protein|nr:hypothetical protein [Helicobacteraceae bacterium]
MRGIFFLFAVCTGLFSIDSSYWSFNEQFSIKKDQFAVFNVDDNFLTVRWSLYHNSGLVIAIKYDHFPYQTILYNDYRQNSIKIPAKTNRTVIPPAPYMTIAFEGFDAEKKEANLRLYLFDELKTITIKRAE